MQTLIVQIFGFAILMAILVKWVFPHLRKILDARRLTIQEMLERIERDKADVEQKLVDLQKRLKRFEAEAQEHFQKTADEAAKMKRQIQDEAKAQAENDLRKAKFEVQLEREKAILELHHETARLTYQAVEKLVDKAADEATHAQLTDKYLADLETVRKP